MKKSRGTVLLCVLAIGACSAGNAAACDYTTVRSAAFEGPRDVHAFLVTTATGEDQGLALGLTDWLQANGGDLNLQVTSVSAEDPGVDWASFALPSAPPKLPVTVLVGNRGGGVSSAPRAFVIDHWEPAPDDAALAALAGSPVREAIKEHVVDAFAVLLYAPGTDGSGGAKRGVVQEVAAQYEPVEADDFDDPTHVVLVELDRSDPAEAILVSFAGIPETGPDWAAVVFGRGKLMAPPFEGDAITESSIVANLRVLEGDCTCLQSPATLGVDLPLRWDPALDVLAAPKLAEVYTEYTLDSPAPPQVSVEVPQEDERLIGTAALVMAAAGAVALGGVLLVLVRWLSDRKRMQE